MSRKSLTNYATAAEQSVDSYENYYNADDNKY